ncbi:hypothetical protein SAMN05444680_1319 [Variovorax sp. YR216]|nr:hypothetical protein SAMN05444680_1319 [Variovorax sp. YR216]
MEAHTNTRRTRIRAIDLPRDPQARAALLKERRRQARRAKRPDHYTGLGIREANVPRARQAHALRSQGQGLREIARALGTTATTISSWLALPPEALMGESH